MTNIMSFIDRADSRSLVLLDELGAGTDPTEGSALARALLERFRTCGATTLVATHYPELKAYAQLTPGVRNASVEFDAKTLQPTYRLSIGLPGRSNAFAIALRLGLPKEIVEDAQRLISRDDRQTEDLLTDIHNLRLQAAQERDRIHAARLEAEGETEELAQRLARIDEERIAILEASREEARAELEAVREEARDLRQRLEAAAVPATEARSVEKELDTLDDLVAEEAEPVVPPTPPPPARPMRAGDRVRVPRLGAEGDVLAIDGQQAEVQVGSARTRVALSHLELLAAPAQEVESSGATYSAPVASVRIDLRGHTVEDALESLDRHLDAASLSNLPWVQIVHGKGTGALRRAIRDFVRSHPLVESYRAGDDGEGGEGVTVTTLVSS
jgi:DNA mismatch repair protein MutS2